MDLDIPIINIKLDMLYGHNAGSHNFIQYMMERLLSNPGIIELTNGTQKRSFLYIDDLVMAINLIVQKHSTLSTNPFISLYLTHPILHTIKEVMQTLKKVTNSTTILDFGSLPYRESEIMETPADNSIYDLLDWTPKFSLEAGLSMVV